MKDPLALAHMIAVITFLVIYLVKTPLLLMNKMEALDKVRRITKVPEMIVSFLFLATGIWMLVMLPSINTLLIIKLVMVFASIPIAIIGFKKKNKAMALIALLLVIGSYGLAEVSKKKRVKGTDIVVDDNNKNDLGKSVYEAKCANCHGPQGNAGVAGAKDLTATTLSKDEIKDISKNGKGMMPGNPDLTPEQLDAVADYVQTLKK